MSACGPERRRRRDAYPVKRFPFVWPFHPRQALARICVGVGGSPYYDGGARTRHYSEYDADRFRATRPAAAAAAAAPPPGLPADGRMICAHPIARRGRGAGPARTVPSPRSQSRLGISPWTWERGGVMRVGDRGCPARPIPARKRKAVEFDFSFAWRWVGCGCGCGC